MTTVRIVRLDEIERALPLDEWTDVVECNRRAMLSSSQGVAKNSISDLNHASGQSHIKGCTVDGEPFFTVKVANVFLGNPPQLPSILGCIAMFDRQTGETVAIFLDDAYITHLRTAGAGALAAQLFSRRDARVLGILGTG